MAVLAYVPGLNSSDSDVVFVFFVLPCSEANVK